MKHSAAEGTRVGSAEGSNELNAALRRATNESERDAHRDVAHTLNRARVDVLLATYNGEEFLRAQIQSILSQDYPCFRVIVHDDGSTDETLSILAEAEALNPGRFVVWRDGKVFGSACRNFLHLLGRSEAELVTFADQDDVWLPGRIGRLAAEFEIESNKPRGVYCDLEVVDAAMNPIAPSLWELQRTPIWISRSSQALAVANCVTGCALMINAAARDRILTRKFDRAVMHDHFAALCIVVDGGDLVAKEQALVRYRQHGRNQIGAVALAPMISWSRVSSVVRDFRALRQSHLQALQVGMRVSFSRFAWWHMQTMRRRHGEVGAVKV